MGETFLGNIGVPAHDGSVRLDMARVDEAFYKVEIHQNRSTFVQCVSVSWKPLPPDQEIMRTIETWAQHDNWAGLSLQQFIRKLHPNANTPSSR